MEMLLIGIAAGILVWILRLVFRRKRSSANEASEISYAEGIRDGAASGIADTGHSRWKWVVLNVGFVAVVSFLLVYFAPKSSIQEILTSQHLHFPVIGAPVTVNAKPVIIGTSNYPIAAIYFLVMLAGMAAEYMFGLKSFKQFAVAEFVRPFWVSLIVFSVPWELVDQSTLTFGSILACYQNGFFWKKVLERRRR